MNYIFRFANLNLLFFLIPIFSLLIIYRLKYYKNIIFNYSLVSLFQKRGFTSGQNAKRFLLILRALSLLILILLIGKPQLADVNSKINIEGVDIILALDVSGSMLCFDDFNDRRSRIEIAKDEATRFINKRDNDQIGIVIFGRHALSKCPLTVDKKILTEIVKDLVIGEIDSGETALATSLITAANRLKTSQAKSKIIILLTDGEPTPADVPSKMAIDIAKKMGIKIYTIGIGSDEGGLMQHPVFGAIPCGSKLNKELLMQIANETGGKFFYAQNSSDMRNIYETIDQLEKTKIETNIFYNYYDFFLALIFLVLFLMLLEQFISTFVWFSL